MFDLQSAPGVSDPGGADGVRHLPQAGAQQDPLHSWALCVQRLPYPGDGQHFRPLPFGDFPGSHRHSGKDDGHALLPSDIPEVDVVITMGCNVHCPFLPCSHREDWGLEDPSGKCDDAFLETIRLIEEKVLDLKARLK